MPFLIPAGLLVIGASTRIGVVSNSHTQSIIREAEGRIRQPVITPLETWDASVIPPTHTLMILRSSRQGAHILRRMGTRHPAATGQIITSVMREGHQHPSLVRTE